MLFWFWCFVFFPSYSIITHNNKIRNAVETGFLSSKFSIFFRPSGLCKSQTIRNPSCCPQTLFRIVDGVMQTEFSIRSLAELQQLSTSVVMLTNSGRLSCLTTCQLFGQHSTNEFLLLLMIPRRYCCFGPFHNACSWWWLVEFFNDDCKIFLLKINMLKFGTSCTYAAPHTLSSIHWSILASKSSSNKYNIFTNLFTYSVHLK